MLSVSLLLAAQMIGALPPDLTTYLSLTQDQTVQIARTNEEHSRWLGEKATRVQQLQAEISVETARSGPDVMALGQRYVAIEAICREVAAKRVETRNKHELVLTEAQRDRLRALDEAIRLVPVISGAQTARLLTGPQIVVSTTPLETYTIPMTTTSTEFSRTDGVRIGVFPANACTRPQASRWFDSTAFVPVP